MFTNAVNGSWGNPPVTGLAPGSPTLVLAQKEDGTGLTATMSGETAGTVNNLWLLSPGGTAFVDQGSTWVAGVQNITLTEAGLYFGYIISSLSGSQSISNVDSESFDGPDCPGQADDNIAFVIADVMTATAVYWPPESDGSYDQQGRPEIGEPCEISCRYEEKVQEIIDDAGTTVISKGELMVDRDIKAGGIIMLGTFADVTDINVPKNNEGAWEILVFTKIPDFIGEEYLRMAFLNPSSRI